MKPSNEPKVQFSRCAFFEQTFQRYKTNARIVDALNHFIIHKSQNPLAPFGGKDRPFSAGPLKGILHASLTNDVSVLYKLGGRDPTIVYLYAIASHDEAGTGHPSNPKRMQQTRIKLDNQTF